MPERCPYCAKPMDGRRPLHATYPTRDHVIPQVLGGERTVMVCRRCNMDKGSMAIQVWQAILERRQDPRAWHVSAFICANPWAVITPRAPLEIPVLELISSVPPGKLAIDRPFGYGQKTRYHCLDCGEIFRKQSHAARHWHDAHKELTS